MPSKMEVSSKHCDTVPNETKDILDTVKIERHTLQSSFCGTLRVPRTFIFSLGQLRSIERFRTVETLGQMRLLTVETVDTVEMNRKVGIGWDPILL